MTQKPDNFDSYLIGSRLSMRQVFLMALVLGLLIPAVIITVLSFNLQRERMEEGLVPSLEQYHAQYGLTNVKTPACPVTGVGSDGLPSYNFQTCTAAALSANPPAGQSSPDWWKRYAFSDGFHPTPYGYQLMSQLVSRSLAQAGWL